MSNWSRTWPLLARARSALRHRIEGGTHYVAPTDPGRPPDMLPRRFTGTEVASLLRSVLEDAAQRGARDQDMAAWLHQLIAWLEPPACDMNHCQHAGGVGSFCRCALERVPGRCPIRRDYRKRAAERERKARAKVLAVLADAAMPASAGWVREAIGNRDPQGLRVHALLEAMVRDGLLRRRGDSLRGVYALTDAGSAAARAALAPCEASGPCQIQGGTAQNVTAGAEGVDEGAAPC